MRKESLGSDALLKLLICGSGGGPPGQLQLKAVEDWLNVDLPKTQHRSPDMVYRATDGGLVHIEVQSTNDPSMPLRMAEYGLAIMRLYGQYPEQLLLYVGNDPLRMPAGFSSGGMVCKYRQVDIRDLDGEAMLASGSICENLLGLVAGLDDPATGIRIVLRRIFRQKKALQVSYVDKLLLTCQLRGLESVAKKEIQKLPDTLQIDIKKWPFLQELLKREVRKEVDKEIDKKVRRHDARARREGLREGRQEGRQEGIRETLLFMLRKRFGRLPATVTKRVTAMSDAQAQKLSLAILDARSIDELFGKTR